jgi:hypothetical protein
MAAVTAAAVIWLGRDTETLAPLSRVVAIVGWLAAWTAACWGAGGMLVRARGGDRLADAVLRLAGGAMILSAAATLLAWTNLLSAVALQVILVVAGLVGIRSLWDLREASPPAIPLAFVAAMMPWVVLAFLLQTPPVMFDVVHYHLAFPSHWLAAGGFEEYARHGFSYYWAGHGSAFTFALATVGPWGASAIGWWFGSLAIAAAGSLGRRFGGAAVGWWSAALVALTPATLQVGTYASSDLPVAAWAGAAALALLRPPGGRPSPTDWGLAGLLVGAAASAKYLALATVALPLGLGALVLTRGRLRSSLAPLLSLVLGAALVVAPWAIRNASWTGNPVYPYFQGLFGGAGSGMSVAADLSQNETEGGVLDSPLARAPVGFVWRTLQPLGQGGLFGLAWLILLPAAVFIRPRPQPNSVFLWTTAVAGLLAWGALVHFARFALPALVIAAPLAARVARHLVAESTTAVVGSFRLLLALLLAWNATAVATQLNLDRIGVLFGALADREYLSRWLDYGDMLPVLNEGLPEDAVILLVGDPRSLYIQRRVLVEDSYRRPLLVEWAAEAGSADALAERLEREGVSHVLVADGHMAWSARLRGNDGFWDDADPSTLRVIDRYFETAAVRIAATERVRLYKNKAPNR